MNQIIIDYNLNESYYMQIYNYFKNEIINGILQEGDKLPSIRQLTTDIKVSKTTVEAAYNQLVVEGYVNNISKKGYFVVHLNEYKFKVNKQKEMNRTINERINYVNSGVDKDSFDIKTWKKLYGNVITEDNNVIFTGGDEQGELLLRENICKFVQNYRGVKCQPEQIVIGAGIQYLLGVLCSLLVKDVDNIAIEDPGFIQAKNVFEDYNMKIIPIDVGSEGIDIDKLYKSKAKLVYISPSHQYPTGSVMPINKRLQILKWARENNSIIIEDDYDCLIRYESRPIPSLQGLDEGRHVIYYGSFSKLLIPSIRISYMILPLNILNKYLKFKNRYSQTSSKIEQLALAQFMKQGYFQKHLRKIKKVYHKKNEIIISYINKYAKNKIKILGHDSGLHMMFEVSTNKKTEDIIRQAQKSRIYLEVVKGYNKNKLVVVFTYSGLDVGEIADILNILISIF
ncbi:MAG: PLP-dependent aminotransferase family protein [Eubacteriaceae bacterium]